MPHHKSAKPTTLSEDANLPVVIIGAGAAGLTAAQELQLANQDYVVLEARDRIGGRIHTQQTPMVNPTFFELGAAWFHQVPQNRLAFIAEEEFQPGFYDDDQTELFDRQGKLDQHLFNELSQKFDEFRAKRDPNDPLDQIASLFARDLSNQYDSRVVSAVTNIYQLLGGQNLAQLGADFQPPAGRDQAVQGGFIKFFEDLLAKDVDRRKIRLQTKVTHVSTPKEGDKVRISLQNGEHIDGKAVIVTVPVSTLKTPEAIQFEPPLNGTLRKAINNTEVAVVDKVYLTFPESFWSPSTYKFIVTDDESPSLVWNWEATHPGTKQKNTLAVLVTNDTAHKVQANPSEAFSIVYPILSAIAGEKEIPEPTQVTTTSWASDPFSNGSFSVVGHHQTREELAQPFIEGEPRSRLLFAGEHATVEGAGLVQGAWESGKRAAQQALQL